MFQPGMQRPLNSTHLDSPSTRRLDMACQHVVARPANRVVLRLPQHSTIRQCMLDVYKCLLCASDQVVPSNAAHHSCQGLPSFDSPARAACRSCSVKQSSSGPSLCCQKRAAA
jgi:hypothetical protein